MAVIENLVIDQGSTFEQILIINQLTYSDLAFDSITNPYIPVDFTGYTAHLQIRKSYDSTTTVLDLTDTTGISLGSNGKLTITITANQSSAILFPNDRTVYYYDLVLINGAIRTRVVEGTITLKRAITH